MSNVLLGVWLILFGITQAGWVSISSVLLGVGAVIVGAILIVERLRG